MKIKAVFNREGGTFRTTDMDAYCERAEQIFRDAGHEIDTMAVDGRDIVKTLEAAAQQGYDALIAGGGDGTISAAAGIAWKTGLPLGVVPAGTMNLFARSLKLPLDIWQVLEVLASAEVQSVDIATANGQPYVHQFSAGLHARMVRLRNRMDYASRFGKMRASTSAAISVMFNPPRFDVVFDIDADGRQDSKEVSAVSVCNNPVGANPLFYADDITTGQLGIYLAAPLDSVGMVGLAIDILRGKLTENQAVTSATSQIVKLHFPKHRHGVACVIDGELLHMPRDVEIRIHPGELKVLAPALLA
ncbi:diacylglycerol kinase family lipid kinase [Agrobacterium vitis]|uniref:Diacylglycerol kinase family lipid kinase n=1 Tax=Agrobacterium vitis TaxID=373 RepID=A0A6L6V9B4_AGRVI|nr:diacylglycerol kinase family protein [Agrobacterium vitis]MUZ71348.1 diacylglycerol kinase family lipid kinase [Agrobacterium vitis]MVA58169.1 diacylglycerol kinase family lipid kinase [Agrobacterium vitis]